MVAFYKHEIAAWMDGTESLSDGAYRAYHVICQLIYLNEGPIALNEHGIAGRCRQSVRAFRKHMDELTRAGKVTVENGRIWNSRAGKELENVSKNRENAKLGGENSGKSRSVASKLLECNDTSEAPLHGQRSLRDETREEKITPQAPQGGRAKRGERINPDWKPAEAEVEFALSLGIPRGEVPNLAAEFVDYWKGVGGQKGCKLDWPATFRNRCRDRAQFKGYQPLAPRNSGWPLPADEPTARAAWLRGSWPSSFGPAPGMPGCKIPESIQREWAAEKAEPARNVA